MRYITSIRQAMSTKNLTQTNLAKLSNLSVSYVSELLHEKRMPSVHTIDTFATILDIPSTRLKAEILLDVWDEDIITTAYNLSNERTALCG